MDIGSGNGYPSASLSNFAPHPFEIDGVKCNSMEGFLQSLKFESIDMQRYVCTLVGKAAKKKGRGKNWQQKQELYWNGNNFSGSSPLSLRCVSLEQNSCLVSTVSDCLFLPIECSNTHPFVARKALANPSFL